MFRYAFYVTSLITVVLVCLLVNEALCENDKKYWLRDQQYWPSIQKYRNLLKKSKASVEDAALDASKLLNNSRKYQGGHERLDMQGNFRPKFRVSFNSRQKEFSHGGHAREGNVQDKVLGHSRESYIRSQASQILKAPIRPLKVEEKPTSLIMYKKGNNLHNTALFPSGVKYMNGSGSIHKGLNDNRNLYQLRAKTNTKTTFFGNYAKITTPSNSFTGKKRVYSEENIEPRVTMIDHNLRWREKSRTPGRAKKGRDFDNYKKERDFDKQKQKLERKEKVRHNKYDQSSEERNFDHFKENFKDYDKTEQEIDEKEKKGNKKRYRSSGERNYDRYKEKKEKKKQHEIKLKETPKTLKEKEVDYGHKKYSKWVPVTAGLSENEEPTTTDKNNEESYYESIDMISEEQQQPSFHETKKVKYPRYPQLQNNNNNNIKVWPVLRTEKDKEETFKSSSIAEQLNSLRKKSKEEVIDQEVIGRTSAGNEIVLWKIKEQKQALRFGRRSNVKKKYVDEPPEKKIVFIVHGLSVMGWQELDCLSQPKRFNTLLRYYVENLDSFDIYIIPMANPDGVEKLNLDKWWNKNDSPQYACPGVNLDRNFDVHWNATHGPSMSSCHQKYPGPKPFSEHETRAVREVFHRYGHKIVAYFHVHAGTYDASVFKGDAVLFPRGYMVQQTEDDKYVDLKADIDDAMRNSSFKTLSVTVDTLHNWYGEVLGTSVDYASTVIGIPYSLELVMQIYRDSPEVKNPDNREKNSALVEIWQVLIDVIFDSIYRNAIKPSEP